MNVLLGLTECLYDGFSRGGLEGYSIHVWCTLFCAVYNAGLHILRLYDMYLA